jgi:fluoroquinolone resistance protein
VILSLIVRDRQPTQKLQNAYTNNETFNGNDFTQNQLPKGEYEACSFNGCSFADTDLSESRFINCTFKDCNLSLVKVDKASFQDAKFIGCKMLGFRFDTCHQLALSFSFDGCQLNHSSFYKTKIKKTIFRNSALKGADFGECDLTGGLFDNCELTEAMFDNTILEKADLKTSFNYAIDPERNRIRKAKFSANGVSGLLGKYDIEIEK